MKKTGTLAGSFIGAGEETADFDKLLNSATLLFCFDILQVASP